jgi:hypothetical protein
MSCFSVDLLLFFTRIMIKRARAVVDKSDDLCWVRRRLLSPEKQGLIVVGSVSSSDGPSCCGGRRNG